MKEALQAWQQMQLTLSLWYEILAFYKYISHCIRDDWQKNMIKRVTFTVDEAEKSAWILKHHWHPVSTVGKQICPSQRPPSLCQPLWFAGSCYLISDSCGLNTSMQDLGSFQQAAREGWLTVPVDHSHWRLDLAQICLIYLQILQPWAMQQETVKSLSNATQWVHPSWGWKVNYAANYGNVSLDLLYTYPAVHVTEIGGIYRNPYKTMVYPHRCFHFIWLIRPLWTAVVCTHSGQLTFSLQLLLQ